MNRNAIPGAKLPYKQLGDFPYFVGFCDETKELSWDREIKRLGVSGYPFRVPTAANTTWIHHADLYHVSIVTLNKKHFRTRPLSELVASLAHEATHVVQNFMRVIGENSPSDEFQAYSVEFVTGWLFERARERIKQPPARPQGEP